MPGIEKRKRFATLRNLLKTSVTDGCFSEKIKNEKIKQKVCRWVVGLGTLEAKEQRDGGGREAKGQSGREEDG